MSENMHTCPTCENPYPRDEEHFHRDPARKDGLKNKCKECVREQGRTYYRNNRSARLATVAARPRAPRTERDRAYNRQYMRDLRARSRAAKSPTP